MSVLDLARRGPVFPPDDGIDAVGPDRETFVFRMGLDGAIWLVEEINLHISPSDFPLRKRLSRPNLTGVGGDGTGWPAGCGFSDPRSGDSIAVLAPFGTVILRQPLLFSPENYQVDVRLKFKVFARFLAASFIFRFFFMEGFS
jgi:hypothetical protein